MTGVGTVSEVGCRTCKYGWHNYSDYLAVLASTAEAGPIAQHHRAPVSRLGDIARSLQFVLPCMLHRALDVSPVLHHVRTALTHRNRRSGRTAPAPSQRPEPRSSRKRPGVGQ